MLPACQFTEQVKRLCSGITVEPVLFLYMLAVFAQYSLFQDLVYIKVCQETFSSEICADLHNETHKDALESVQKDSSYWILLSTVALVIPSLLVAIYLGSWSDKFGRKWPIVFPPLGGCLACVVYIILSFVPTIPVSYICLASFLSGLTGGFVSCIMSCMTYVATVSSEENRTVRISRLEAMISLGGTIGPFISGSMLEITGHGYAFLFMMGCYATACLYVILFVKDVAVRVSVEDEVRGATPCSVQTEEDQRKTLLTHSKQGHENEGRGIKEVNSCGSRGPPQYVSVPGDDFRMMETESCCSKYFSASHFVDAVKTVVKKRENNQRTVVLLLILAGYLTMIITAGELDVAYLYAKGEPLTWTYKTYSYYFGFKYGLGVFMLVVGMPIFKRFGVGDITICQVGLISRFFGLILYAFSPSTIIAFLVPLVAAFTTFTVPATRALLSKMVLPSEQGKMFAFVAVLEDLCTLSASVLFNSIYPLTRKVFPGFIFIIASGILVVPMITFGFIQKLLKPLENESSLDVETQGSSTTNETA